MLVMCVIVSHRALLADRVSAQDFGHDSACKPQRRQIAHHEQVVCRPPSWVICMLLLCVVEVNIAAEELSGSWD